MVAAALLPEIAALRALTGGRLNVTVARIVSRDRALGPVGAPVSPNGHSRLIRAADGWIAVSMAREEDIAAIPAWLGLDHVADDPWHSIAAAAASQSVAALIAQGIALHLPVAAVGEAAPRPPALLSPRPAPPRAPDQLRVIDLSALWAGPLTGGLLAMAGADVLRIDTRPDPTEVTTPAHFAFLNGGKARRALPLNDPALLALIDNADVLISSARPHALAHHGLTPDTLFARNPRLLWVAVTAHGCTGDAALRVGFGDDAAAAGGLLGGTEEAPHFLGDALADPVTGLLAAQAAMAAAAEGQAGLVDAAMAPAAAVMAERLRG